MRLSVSLTALIVCCLAAVLTTLGVYCLVAVWTRPAPDAPASQPAASDPAQTGPGSGSQKRPNATEPGSTVLATFPGDSGPGPKDGPDNSGAVGPDHVVDFTNANVVIHDKKTGEVIRRMTQTEFWKDAKPAFDFPALNDPRLLYDPLSGRWFAVAAEFKKLSLGYLA